MSEAANLAILRDVFVLAMLALGIGLFAYAAMRRVTGHQWHADGNVLSRPYDGGDGVVALMLVSFFGVSFFQEPSGVPVEKAAAELSYGALIFNAGFFLAVCLALLLYMTIIRGFNPAEMFGLRLATVGRAAWQGAAIICVVYICVQFFTWLFYSGVLGGEMPDDSSQEMVQAFKASKSILFKVALGVAAVIIAPLTEEFIFRGYIYGVTKRFTDRWFAAMFSAAIFAVIHHNVAATLPLFLLAVGLAAAYEVTGCLLVPIMMHAIFNAWNLVMLSLQ